MLSLEYLKNLNQESTQKNYLVDWNKEIHKLTNNVVKIDLSREDLLSELNSKEHAIKDNLKLFSWQKAYVNILEKFENSRFIKTELPYSDEPKQSLLYSDVAIISSKLGSGKTYSIFAHIAKNPYPPKKKFKVDDQEIEGWKIIKGYAPIYNLMFKIGSEKSYMSKSVNDVTKLSCTSFIPAYFNNNEYKPSILMGEYYTDILKFNVVICKEALVDQMASYLDRDFKIPYITINNTNQLINFVIKFLSNSDKLSESINIIILGTFIVYKTDFINTIKKKINNFINNKNENIKLLLNNINKNKDEIVKCDESLKKFTDMLNEENPDLTKYKGNPTINDYKTVLRKKIILFENKKKEINEQIKEYEDDIILYNYPIDNSGYAVLNMFLESIQEDINEMNRNVNFNSIDVLYLAQMKSSIVKNSFKPFARIFYDDYDQLNFSSTIFIPAVNSYYISATRGIKETPYIHSIPSYNSILYALTNICVEIPKNNNIIGLTDEPIYLTYKCINPYKINYIYQLLQMILNYEQENISQKYILNYDAEKKQEDLNIIENEKKKLDKIILSDSINEIIEYIDKIIFNKYIQSGTLKTYNDKNKKINKYIKIILNHIYNRNKYAMISNITKKNIMSGQNKHNNISKWLLKINKTNNNKEISYKLKNIIDTESIILQSENFQKASEIKQYEESFVNIDNTDVITIIFLLKELEKSTINNNNIWTDIENPFKYISTNNISDTISQLNKLVCFKYFTLYAPYFMFSYYTFLNSYYTNLINSQFLNNMKIILGKNNIADLLYYTHKTIDNENKHICDICKNKEKQIKYITKCCYSVICDTCITNIFSKHCDRKYSCCNCKQVFNENKIKLEILPNKNLLLLNRDFTKGVNINIQFDNDNLDGKQLLFNDSLNYYSCGIPLNIYEENYQTILGKMNTSIITNIIQKESNGELSDKNTTLINIYKKQKYLFETEQNKKNIKILVYALYNGAYESFIKYVKEKNIELNVPLLNNTVDLENFKDNQEQEIAFIISNELYSGVNSEWCDILVLYQKFDSLDLTEQIIARGQRTGRVNQLIVCSLKYDSEIYQLDEIMNAIQ